MYICILEPGQNYSVLDWGRLSRRLWKAGGFEPHKSYIPTTIYEMLL
jgi:hypothetical protein